MGRMAMGRALVLLVTLFAVSDAAVIMYDKPDVAFLACKAELQFDNPAFTCSSFAEDISTKQQAHNIPKQTLKDVCGKMHMALEMVPDSSKKSYDDDEGTLRDWCVKLWTYPPTPAPAPAPAPAAPPVEELEPELAVPNSARQDTSMCMPAAARQAIYTCKEEFDKQTKEHEEAEAARKLQLDAI